MSSDPFRPLPWMVAFFIAMAFLESAVVVYLRALYYPEGFDFPLVSMDPGLVVTELGREIATMIMLFAPAALVTQRALERFAWFCFGFGVWDIFYYVWLKVLLDWPASFGTMDLLFLIPVPWVGPVWAPVVISIGLITLAILILKRRTALPGWRPDKLVWGMLLASVVLFLIAFMYDPVRQGFSVADLTRPEAFVEAYIPGPFPWWWFTLGVLAGFTGLVRMVAKPAAGIPSQGGRL
jgi:hypothetical protein